MDSIFTKIIKGEIPAFKVAENDDFLAFLDIFPLQPGHTLVIPKVQIDYIFDLEESVYNGLMSFARDVAKAIKPTVDCERIGVVVMGLEVPHAHIHLIPIKSMEDMNFANPKLKLSSEEFTDITEKISKNYLALFG